MICSSCGFEIAGEYDFCPNCGQPSVATAASAQDPQTEQQAEPTGSVVNPVQPEFTQQPYQAEYQSQTTASVQPPNSRLLAMTFYLCTLVGLIIGVVKADRTDPFIKHHLNQALSMWIVAFVAPIVWGIVIFILAMLLSRAMGSLELALLLYGGIFIVIVAVLVLMIMGALNAHHSTMKKLPLIGKLQLLK